MLADDNAARIWNIYSGNQQNMQDILDQISDWCDSNNISF